MDRCGVKRLAVSTIAEASHLRRYNVTVPIHVLGKQAAVVVSGGNAQAIVYIGVYNLHRCKKRTSLYIHYPLSVMKCR